MVFKQPRIFSVPIAFCLLLPSLSWAFQPKSSPEAGVRLSPGLGKITAVFDGNPNGPRVVLIQDLHCQEEVQRNIARIIQSLAQTQPLAWIGVEGSTGPISLEAFSGISIPEVREGVASFFLRSGRLTGAEYAAALAGPQLHLEGLENPDFYRESFQLARTLLRDEVLGLALDLKSRLHQAARHSSAPDDMLARGELVERLLNISATPEDLAKFQAEKEKFSGAQFNRVFAETSLPLEQDDQEKLDESLRLAGKFYRLANARTRILAGNMVNCLREHRQSLGLLVAGGFHTRGLEACFRQAGVSFVTVEPAQAHPGLPNPYFQLLQGKPTSLEKMFHLEPAWLALPTATRSLGFRQALQLVGKALTMFHVLRQSGSKLAAAERHDPAGPILTDQHGNVVVSIQLEDRQEAVMACSTQGLPLAELPDACVLAPEIELVAGKSPEQVLKTLSAAAGQGWMETLIVQLQRSLNLVGGQLSIFAQHEPHFQAVLLLSGLVSRELNAPASSGKRHPFDPDAALNTALQGLAEETSPGRWLRGQGYSLEALRSKVRLVEQYSAAPDFFDEQRAVHEHLRNGIVFALRQGGEAERVYVSIEGLRILESVFGPLFTEALQYLLLFELACDETEEGHRRAQAALDQLPWHPGVDLESILALRAPDVRNHQFSALAQFLEDNLVPPKTAALARAVKFFFNQSRALPDFLPHQNLGLTLILNLRTLAASAVDPKTHQIVFDAQKALEETRQVIRLFGQDGAPGRRPSVTVYAWGLYEPSSFSKLVHGLDFSQDEKTLRQEVTPENLAAKYGIHDFLVTHLIKVPGQRERVYIRIRVGEGNDTHWYSSLIGYDTKSATYRDGHNGTFSVREGYGNVFSLAGGVQPKPMWTQTEIRQLVEYAAGFGIKIIFDFVPWMPVEAAGVKNVSRFQSEELPLVEAEYIGDDPEREMDALQTMMRDGNNYGLVRQGGKLYKLRTTPWNAQDQLMPDFSGQLNREYWEEVYGQRWRGLQHSGAAGLRIDLAASLDRNVFERLFSSALSEARKMGSGFSLLLEMYLHEKPIDYWGRNFGLPSAMIKVYDDELMKALARLDFNGLTRLFRERLKNPSLALAMAMMISNFDEASLKTIADHHHWPENAVQEFKDLMVHLGVAGFNTVFLLRDFLGDQGEFPPVVGGDRRDGRYFSHSLLDQDEYERWKANPHWAERIAVNPSFRTYQQLMRGPKITGLRIQGNTRLIFEFSDGTEREFDLEAIFKTFSVPEQEPAVLPERPWIPVWQIRLEEKAGELAIQAKKVAELLQLPDPLYCQNVPAGGALTDVQPKLGELFPEAIQANQGLLRFVTEKFLPEMNETERAGWLNEHADSWLEEYLTWETLIHYFIESDPNPNTSPDFLWNQIKTQAWNKLGIRDDNLADHAVFFRQFGLEIIMDKMIGDLERGDCGDPFLNFAYHTALSEGSASSSPESIKKFFQKNARRLFLEYLETEALVLGVMRLDTSFWNYLRQRALEEEKISAEDVRGQIRFFRKKGLGLGLDYMAANFQEIFQSFPGEKHTLDLLQPVAKNFPAAQKGDLAAGVQPGKHRFIWLFLLKLSKEEQGVSWSVDAARRYFKVYGPWEVAKHLEMAMGDTRQAKELNGLLQERRKLKAELREAVDDLKNGKAPQAALAMSVVHAGSAGMVYTGLAAWFGFGWLALATGVFFGLQMGLIISIWARYNAAQAPENRESLIAWLWRTGGLLATADAGGILEQYLPHAPPLTTQWFGLHEGVENKIPVQNWLAPWLPRSLSWIGPVLNHIFSAATDPVTFSDAFWLMGKEALTKRYNNWTNQSTWVFGRPSFFPAAFRRGALSKEVFRIGKRIWSFPRRMTQAVGIDRFVDKINKNIRVNYTVHKKWGVRWSKKIHAWLAMATLYWRPMIGLVAGWVGRNYFRIVIPLLFIFIANKTGRVELGSEWQTFLSISLILGTAEGNSRFTSSNTLQTLLAPLLQHPALGPELREFLKQSLESQEILNATICISKNQRTAVEQLIKEFSVLPSHDNLVELVSRLAQFNSIWVIMELQHVLTVYSVLFSFHETVLPELQQWNDVTFQLLMAGGIAWRMFHVNGDVDYLLTYDNPGRADLMKALNEKFVNMLETRLHYLVDRKVYVGLVHQPQLISPTHQNIAYTSRLLLSNHSGREDFEKTRDFIRDQTRFPQDVRYHWDRGIRNLRLAHLEIDPKIMLRLLQLGMLALSFKEHTALWVEPFVDFFRKAGKGEEVRVLVQYVTEYMIYQNFKKVDQTIANKRWKAFLSTLQEQEVFTALETVNRGIEVFVAPPGSVMRRRDETKGKIQANWIVTLLALAMIAPLGSVFLLYGIITAAELDFFRHAKGKFNLWQRKVWVFGQTVREVVFPLSHELTRHLNGEPDKGLRPNRRLKITTSA